MDHFIPLSVPNFVGNERKYVDEAVDQGWVSTGGAYVNKLESMMEEYLNVDQVAVCQSGTSAIHLALVDAEVGPNDMVIVPTLTFIAAVNPVRYQFANPAFIDCDDSLCMDPIKLAEFCALECTFVDSRLIHKATGNVVKAIIVVHVFGNIADMDAIMTIAEKYNLKVIEDATEALGSKYIKGRYAGKYAGTIGDYGAFSFNGNKIITTGGGGAITSRYPDRVKHIKYLSTQAKDDEHYYIHNEIGYNYRMTNVQAAIGVAQMEELEGFVEVKNSNYRLYEELFSGYVKADLMKFREDIRSNKWFYSLVVKISISDKAIKEIIEELQNRGIQTRPIWGLIHEQKPYANCPAYSIEKAKIFSKCIINIPSSTQISEEDIRYVVKQCKDVLDQID